MKHSQGRFALRATTRLTLAAIAAATFSFSASAAENVDLDVLTVTTNRMPSENLLAPTTIITRADIERLQINDLPSLLARQPGIDMTVNGGLGKASSIHMRGTSTRHVLILVDGVKWQSATLGETNIQDFPTEQIERIEIVRGPRSGLYGSEAIGGVIQIFTRKGQQGLNPFAKVSYGTHDTRQASVGVNGGNDRTSYNLSVNHQATNGISALDENTNTDNDGYRNNSLSAKVNHQLTDKVAIGANFFRAEADNEHDSEIGFFNPNAATDKKTSDSVQQVLGLNASFQLTENWLLSSQFSESRDQSNNFENGQSTSVIDTRHRFFNVSSTVALNENNTLNFGFDYDQDQIQSSENYLADERFNRAVFVSWQAFYDKHSWLISGRHDDNEAFGTHNTGTAEWGYWLSDALQFTTSYGTAFKTPTFNDLYWPLDAYGNIGNPDLLPEESTSWSAGLNGTVSEVDWAVNVFKTKISDLIEWAPVDPNNTFGAWTPSNVAEAEIKGIEVELATTLFGADIMFDATWLQPEDKATGNTLKRRAKRYANLHVDKKWGQWSAGASWKLSGHRYEDAANDTRLGGYGLVDLRASYQVDKNWTLQANVSNLFDKEYQTVENYNSLDRVAMFTVLYQPK